jgi:hypothetical protein
MTPCDALCPPSFCYVLCVVTGMLTARLRLSIAIYPPLRYLTKFATLCTLLCVLNSSILRLLRHNKRYAHCALYMVYC